MYILYKHNVLQDSWYLKIQGKYTMFNFTVLWIYAVFESFFLIRGNTV